MLLANTSSILFLAGLALLAVLLLRRSWRYFGGRRRGHIDRPIVHVTPKTERRDRALIDAPPELLRWQVEMHETAREMKAELDTKMGLLQQLILNARAEQQRLADAIDKARRLGIAGCPDTLEAIERAATEPLGSDGTLPLDGLPPLDDEPTPVDNDAQSDSICRLADKGHSPALIADIVGAALGDVEMVLSLRGQ